MFARVMKMALAVAITVALGSAAEACARKTVSGGSKLVPQNRIDQAVLDRAILAEVNYWRCKRGLSKLKGTSKLRKTATNHSKYMAKVRSLTHKSRVSGQQTTAARITGSGLSKVRRGSENIGVLYRYQFDAGRRFKIASSAQCQFATNSGKPIPPHTYSSLARMIVKLWMESPSHRVNILDRNVQMTASAAWFDPRASYCGQFYVTQQFAG